MGEEVQESRSVTVNFTEPRGFKTTLESSLKETFFPDDPFRPLRNQPFRTKACGVLKYFCPILDWGSKYTLKLFQGDLLAGITIASLAIPQGISYAKLANLPPIIGLYSSFVPPLIYAIFGSSKDMAVGPVAACSLLSASIIGKMVSVTDNPDLYLHLFFTATFFTGVLQAAMGVFRLGILVDFLSRSTILGFMGGTATIIILQQLKGFFGLTKFTTHTDIVSVLRAIFRQTHEWRWQSTLMGVCLLLFLVFSKYLSKKNRKFFLLSAIAPMVVVIIGGAIAYFGKVEEHGIHIVGPLNKGLNPLSIGQLNFQPQYLGATLKTGLITGVLALAEGIAVGRVFSVMKNYQTDGNKEMIAFGLMNIMGSFTSCYLTTGPFSKSAVNYNAGCKTAGSNIVMSICMMLVLLFLAPLFSYTPIVALSAIIMSAMFGLIKYKEVYKLYKVDKFDFIICMAAFFGVVFIRMEVGLLMSVGISVVRALLYVARPGVSKMGKVTSTGLYRDIKQYPQSKQVPGILVLHLGSSIYFASAGYYRERIARWVDEEQELISANQGEDLHYVILDIGGVSTIDKTGIDMLAELWRILDKKGIKLMLSNPTIEVTEKLVTSSLVDIIGKDYVFVSVDQAVMACRFMFEGVHNDKSC